MVARTFLATFSRIYCRTQHNCPRNMKASWTQIVPSPSPTNGSPLPRSSHGISTIPSPSPAASNGGAGAEESVRIYVHGGEHVARTPLDESQCTWCAERQDGKWKWTLVQPSSSSSSIKPPKRIGHAQCAVGSKIYIFGGRAGIEIGESALNDLWELDCSVPGQEQWKEVQYAADGGDGPPQPRSYHKMISDNDGNLYVFGGCGSNGRLADLYKFNLQTKEWTDHGSSPLLAGRGGANFLLLDHGKKLAAIAGFVGHESRDGHCFDVDSAKWEEQLLGGLENLRPRSVCTSGTISLPGTNSTVGFIFGGEVDPSDKGHDGAGSFENDVVLLDGVSGSMVQVIKSTAEEIWPQSRGWADGSAGNGGTFYLFGGLTGNDENPQRLGDLWECTIRE